MNVTRDVITDLLPAYFSGEASEGTKRLVEDYFREDPEFERIARRAATPLEALHGSALVATDTEKEKRDLQRARERLLRGGLWLGLMVLLTGLPIFKFNLFSPGWPTDVAGVLWLGASVMGYFQLHRRK